MKVAVTGAGGFVGKTLVERLFYDGINCLPIYRKQPSDFVGPVTEVLVADLEGESNWGDNLNGCDVVIHAAARVHMMNENATDPLKEFRKINVDGTVNLARGAVKAGVRRFIYISTVKVLGEQTERDKPFDSVSVANAVDPYAISKLEAERNLIELGNSSGMEIVIVRPPLIYGEGVKANFAALLNLASMRYPLPFGGFNRNSRSLVYIENLIDMLIICLDHPNAKNREFLVSDGEDLSTADMFCRLRKACGHSGWLLPFPDALFKAFCSVIARPQLYQRLCGSLQVEISDTVERLDWEPPYTLEEGFARTARYYLDNR